ncbi:hypothetical protein [Nocardioides sp.]|uniref:hypothetical protein n=1 Tax=Nocardioides sp. TaxID=35761 RepID=UPI003513EE10
MTLSHSPVVVAAEPAAALAGTVAEAADLAGRGLAGLTRALGALRPADKPLHPRGTTFAAELTRHRSSDPIGVPWLDQAGTDQVLVRLSRAVGLPGPLPDVAGLALRLRRGQTRYADLLLASTGWNPVSRHLLLPALGSDAPMTSLLPYRSPAGPLVVGARPRRDDATRFTLSWAMVGGHWHPFADLTLTDELRDGADVSFDPVLNPLPGLEQYNWVERVRGRSYAAARRSR